MATTVFSSKATTKTNLKAKSKKPRWPSELGVLDSSATQPQLVVEQFALSSSHAIILAL